MAYKLLIKGMGKNFSFLVNYYFNIVIQLLQTFAMCQIFNKSDIILHNSLLCFYFCSRTFILNCFPYCGLDLPFEVF